VDYFACEKGRGVMHFSVYGCNYIFGLRDMILTHRRAQREHHVGHPLLLQLTTATAHVQLTDDKEGSGQASCASPGWMVSNGSRGCVQCVVCGMAPFLQLFLSQVAGARGRSQMRWLQCGSVAAFKCTGVPFDADMITLTHVTRTRPRTHTLQKAKDDVTKKQSGSQPYLYEQPEAQRARKYVSGGHVSCSPSDEEGGVAGPAKIS